MLNLFTYGSLMCSDIMYHVAGCRPAFVSATLKDFQRFKIRGEEYPGIISHPGSQVEGILYLSLPPTAIERLDRFEGEQYNRQELPVMTEHNGPDSAMAYVVKSRYRNLVTEETWSYLHFLAVGKERFLNAYLGFHKI